MTQRAIWVWTSEAKSARIRSIADFTWFEVKKEAPCTPWCWPRMKTLPFGSIWIQRLGCCLLFFLQTGTLWHRCFLKKSMSTHPGWRRGEYAENTRRMTAGIACIASRVAPQTWLMKFASKDGQRYSLQIFILKSVPISSVWSWLKTFNHWWVLSLHLEFLLPGARFGLGGSFENRTWL